jgi:hypothetical protein
MKLIDAKTLLETQFEEGARPSMRWLREHQRELGCVKIGRLVFFDPVAVQTAIEKRMIKRRAA